MYETDGTWEAYVHGSPRKEPVSQETLYFRTQISNTVCNSKAIRQSCLVWRAKVEFANERLTAGVTATTGGRCTDAEIRIKDSSELLS